LGKELESAQPPWDEIQKQATEYSKLTAELVKCEPGMGTKESWQKLTTAFATNAATFDSAAQAKDREAAKTAHGLLSDSCMQCHREHRRMKGGKAG
jgi:hypothetical protein